MLKRDWLFKLAPLTREHMTHDIAAYKKLQSGAVTFVEWRLINH
jgi:hypothetical protein